ncbi:TetR/AcrR family transcriptional regulator [Desulfosporosinus sp. SB140]|uniref:TetR/AcrR family transcriptional regulator n=1 Tax=Desulfosporosinus paludis TaxID=3115649 RepID=UPI00388F2A09
MDKVSNINKRVRKPKQLRSINTKEKILEVAFSLFCKKGYYNTTTNEIAKQAEVSIGSLYSYYKDKDTILLEILELYNQQFITIKEEVLAQADIFKEDKKVWFRLLIDSFIKAHEASKELIRELNVLYYVNPQVAAILDKQREESRQATLDYIFLHKEDIQVEDIEAAATLAFDFATSIVDRVVFGQNNIDKERIIKTGIDAIYKFLFY